MILSITPPGGPDQKDVRQRMTVKPLPSKQKAHWLGMAFATFAVIQLDALAAVIPHQVLSMGITPVVWGTGAAVL